MLTALLTFFALDCAASAAVLVQRAHAVQVEGVFVLLIAVLLLILGAGLLALAKGAS